MNKRIDMVAEKGGGERNCKNRRSKGKKWETCNKSEKKERRKAD
jgi:hypothetical protein